MVATAETSEPIAVPEDRELFISMGSWQDSNLQVHGSFHLTLHSFLLAIGVGLFVYVLSSSRLVQMAFGYLLMLIICLASFVVLREMQKVTLAAEKTVDYWDRLLIYTDLAKSPSQRHYIRHRLIHYPVGKSHKYTRGEYPSDDEVASITYENLQDLVGESSVRRFLSRRLFTVIRWIWVGLIVIIPIYFVIEYSFLKVITFP